MTTCTWLLFLDDFTDEREMEIEYHAKRLHLRVISVQTSPDCVFTIEGTQENVERLEEMYSWIYQVTPAEVNDE